MMTAHGHATRARRYPLTIPQLLLAVVAGAAQWILYAGGIDLLPVALYASAAANLVIGIVLGLGYTILRDTDKFGELWQQRTLAQAAGVGKRMAFVAIAQTVVAIPGAILYAVTGPWDDGSVVLFPLFFVLVAAFGMLAGWLIDMFVVWPIAGLVEALWRRATGRPVINPVAAPLSSFLLATLASGITVAAASRIETYGPMVVQGGSMIVEVMFSPSSEPMFWAARASVLLMLASVVWLAYSMRRAYLAQRR